MNKQTMNKSPGLSGWLTGLLVGSLALNLVLIGVVSGQWWSQSRSAPAPLAWVMGDGLAEETASVLPSLRERRAVSRQARQAIRANLARLRDVLHDHPIDQDALQEALADLRQARTDHEALIHDMVLNALATMDEPQRRAFLDRLFRDSTDRVSERPSRGTEEGQRRGQHK